MGGRIEFQGDAAGRLGVETESVELHVSCGEIPIGRITEFGSFYPAEGGSRRAYGVLVELTEFIGRGYPPSFGADAFGLKQAPSVVKGVVMVRQIGVDDTGRGLGIGQLVGADCWDRGAVGELRGPQVFRKPTLFSDLDNLIGVSIHCG